MRLSPAVDADVVPAVWAEARVIAHLGGAQYRLDDGRVARQAASCLLAPQAGDTVLSVGCGAGIFIVHLLERADFFRADLSVPGADRLTIRQPEIEMVATRQVAIRAWSDIELTAATGSVMLNARNLLSTIADSMVLGARYLVGNAEQCVLQAKGLMKIHGKQALLTADEDIKADAERVSLG